MIRLVLFDIDGTLIRTGGAGMRAFERTLAVEFGVPRATEGVKFSGRTDPAIVRECFEKLAIKPSKANFQRFYDHYVFWLDFYLNEMNGAPCPGVLDLLADIAESQQAPLVGLLTGNIRLGAEIKLRHYDLWRHFRMGAFGDDHENRNELAAVARKRGQKLLQKKLPGREILVIGDTPFDIECGKSIGAKVLAVSTGGSSFEELEKHGADWTVRNLNGVRASELCG